MVMDCKRGQDLATREDALNAGIVDVDGVDKAEAGQGVLESMKGGKDRPMEYHPV